MKSNVIKRFYKNLKFGEEKFTDFYRDWDRYEKYFKNDFSTVLDINRYIQDDNGNLVLVRNMEVDGIDFLPEREENYIYVLIETLLSQFNMLDPIPYLFTLSNDKNIVEICRYANLYLKNVFNKSFKKEYLIAVLNAVLFGFGFIKVEINGSYLKPIAIKSKDVFFDYTVDDFDKIKWFIHKVIKTYGEVKELFDNTKEVFGEKEDNDSVIVYEYYEYDEKNKEWGQFFIANNNLLKKRGETAIVYPVLPFELFKTNILPNSCIGQSEVAKIEDYQISINKKMSLLDYKYVKDEVPPVSVVSGVNTTDLPIRAGKYYNVNSPADISPIRWDSISPEGYLTIIGYLKQAMSDTTGVQRALLGQNEKGVYNASHFGKILEGVYTRIKNKEFWFVFSIERLARKIVYLLKGLTAVKNISVFDYEKNEFVMLKPEWFDLDKIDIQIETVDLAIIDPSAKLDKLINLRQYVPELDGREIIFIADRLLPRVFSKDYIEFLRKVVKQERENYLLKLELDRETLKAQLKQLSQPVQTPIGVEEVSLEGDLNRYKQVLDGLGITGKQQQEFLDKMLSDINSILAQQGLEPTRENVISLLEQKFEEIIKQEGVLNE